MANYNSAVNRKCAPGNKYGYLTVVKFVTSKDMWECNCICGKVVYRRGAALHKYKNPNCGCKKGTYAMLPNQLAHKRAIIADYKRHAKDRGYQFNLTDEQTIDLILKDCFYCGTPPSNEKTVKPSRKIRNKYACTVTSLFYNGIDRVDNTIDYILSNCVPCCNFCNSSKRDKPLSDWKSWIKRVYQKTFNDYPVTGVEPSGSKQETPEKSG